MLLSGAQAALGTRVLLSGAAAAAHRCCDALSCSLVTMLLVLHNSLVLFTGGVGALVLVVCGGAAAQR
jgi:hypothetical protein